MLQKVQMRMSDLGNVEPEIDKSDPGRSREKKEFQFETRLNSQEIKHTRAVKAFEAFVLQSTRSLRNLEEKWTNELEKQDE